MIEYIRFLTERYDHVAGKSEKKQFIRNLMVVDALHNLDLISVLALKSLSEKPEERRKVLACFRSNAEDLLESLGLSAATVLDGEFPEEIDEMNRSGTPEGVRLNSKEDFKRQSPLWLYSFASRKVRILRVLAGQDFDVNAALHLQHRLKNAGLAYQVLVERLRAPKPV